MNITELKAAVLEGFMWAQRVGFKVIEGDYGSKETGCGCALSCAYWANGGTSGHPIDTTYAKAFGLSTDDVDAFIRGFDAEFKREVDSEEFYDLGRMFRTDLGL